MCLIQNQVVKLQFREGVFLLHGYLKGGQNDVELSLFESWALHLLLLIMVSIEFEDTTVRKPFLELFLPFVQGHLGNDDYVKTCTRFAFFFSFLVFYLSDNTNTLYSLSKSHLIGQNSIKSSLM